MGDVVTTDKKKSFWDKPEGLWGMMLIAVLGAGVLWFLSWFVPFMLKLGLGLLGVGLVWGTIAAIGVVVFTDNPLRQAITLKVQMLARNLRSAVINEDPIGILRLLQSKAKKRLEEFEDMLPGVRKAKYIVGQAMTNYSAKMEKHRAAATLAGNSGDREEETRALGKYGKASDYYHEMLSIKNGIEGADALLVKAKKAVQRVIEDADDEIDNNEIRLKATAVYSGVMGKLRSVFRTSSDEEEVRKEALRAAADKAAEQLGKIDQFTQDFNELLTNVGNADAVNAEMVRQKLQTLNSYQLDNNASPTIKLNQVASKAAIPVRK
jgi:hypothetical protein